MAHLQYFSYEGVGKRNLEKHGYNQAVRVGDVIHISGQGGWDRTTFAIPSDIDAQIDQAFENVDCVIKDAGGTGWPQVFRVNSYHVPLDAAGMAAMTRNFHRWMPEHKALWTCVGVPKLGDEAMKVEIEVQAHDAK